MARIRSSGRKKALNTRKASTRVRKATQRTTTTTTTTSTTQSSVVNNSQDANVEVNGAGNGAGNSGGGNQPVEAQAKHQQPQSPGEFSRGCFSIKYRPRYRYTFNCWQLYDQ